MRPLFSTTKNKKQKKSIKLSKFEPLDPLTPSLFYLFHGEWCLSQFQLHISFHDIRSRIRDSQKNYLLAFLLQIMVNYIGSKPTNQPELLSSLHIVNIKNQSCQVVKYWAGHPNHPLSLHSTCILSPILDSLQWSQLGD